MKKLLLSICMQCIFLLLFSQDSCFRVPFAPINAIPNPTFDLLGAPCHSGYLGEFGSLVPGWFSPSYEMPTAYLNTCTGFQLPDSVFTDADINNGKIINSNLCLYPKVPQPVPGNGMGVMAVSDFGWGGDSTVYPYYKSYIATCLGEVLKKDSLYRLDFYIGFGDPDTSFLMLKNYLLAPQHSLETEQFALFGLPDCSDASSPLPVLGCISFGTSWVQLGAFTASSGLGSWVKASIVFTPAQDIYSIALGPSCNLVRSGPTESIAYKDTSLSTRFHSYFLDSLQLYEAPIRLPVISLEGSLCDQTVTLQVQPASFYTGSVISWYRNDALLPADNDSLLVVSRQAGQQGVYRCTIQNSNICVSTDSINVQWLPLPSSSVLSSSDTIICTGDTLALNAFTDTTATYTWQDGSTDSTYEVTMTGTYSVRISNSCGTAVSSRAVTVSHCTGDVIVPNAFTPNGDGKNDVFKVSYTNSPESFNMRIYNRYGQVVFSSTDPARGWDGNLNGMKQPADAYVWLIEYLGHSRQAPEHISGTVVLIR